MLPLLSLYSMTCVEKGIIPITDLSIRPAKIVKKRVRHGTPCLEILWDIDGMMVAYSCLDISVCLYYLFFSVPGNCSLCVQLYCFLNLYIRRLGTTGKM